LRRQDGAEVVGAQPQGGTNRPHGDSCRHATQDGTVPQQLVHAGIGWTGEKTHRAFAASWRRIGATLLAVLRRNTLRHALASSPWEALGMFCTRATRIPRALFSGKVKGPGALPPPTRVSPAPTTEYEQHDNNDQQGFHVSPHSEALKHLRLSCIVHVGSVAHCGLSGHDPTIGSQHVPHFQMPTRSQKPMGDSTARSGAS